MNWSHSSLRTPAVRYTVSWPLSTSRWIDSHPIACFFRSLRLPALRTIFKWASWVIFSVAIVAALQWTKWCLRCCCVTPGGAVFEAPVVRLHSAWIAPSWSISGVMTCCCGMVRKTITKSSGKSWRLYSYLQVKMELVTANLHLQFKLNPAAYSCRGFQRSCDLELVVPMLSLCSQGYSVMNDSWYLRFDRYKRIFFDGKDVWWCLSQDITGILHESHTNQQVFMYG